jgi:hypothetical protein
MKAKSWHQIHKYLAIVAGIFFLAWTISGIVMMTPLEWYEPTPLKSGGAPDYSLALISPAEAVEQLEGDLGSPVDAVALELKTINARPVYDILAANVGSKLVDAISGDVIKITPELAEEIAREAVQSESEVQSNLRIKEHSISYPYGQLPVFRILFYDHPGEVYYVTVQDGKVSQSNWMTRLRFAITSLHTFEPLKLISDNDKIRQVSLIVTAFLSILVAITGYYLAILPMMRRRQRKNKPTPAKNGEEESL